MTTNEPKSVTDSNGLERTHCPVLKENDFRSRNLREATEDVKLEDVLGNDSHEEMCDVLYLRRSQVDLANWEIAYDKAGCTVKVCNDLGIVLKSAPDSAEMFAQYLALKILREDGFSAPRARLLMINEETSGSESVSLLMEAIPKDFRSRLTRAYEHNHFPLDFRVVRQAGERLLELHNLKLDEWVGDMNCNVGLVDGALDRIAEGEPVTKQDLIPFDPVVGFLVGTSIKIDGIQYRRV